MKNRLKIKKIFSILQRCPETTTQWSTQILEPTKWSRLSENMAPHTKALKGRCRTIPSEATIIVQATGRCALATLCVLTAVEFLREALGMIPQFHNHTQLLPCCRETEFVAQKHGSGRRFISCVAKNILCIARRYAEHPHRPALPAAQNWHIDEKLATFPKAS